MPEITSPKIEAYVESRLEEGAANATINRELSALKHMVILGARQTPPKVDRVPYIPMLEENNVRKEFFEHAEFVALRDALPDHLKDFVTFAYKTGWRLSEITDLTWNQVDLETVLGGLNQARQRTMRAGRSILTMSLEIYSIINGKSARIFYLWCFLTKREPIR